MGNLVVGNYDLVGDPASGNAFIYNFSSNSYTLLSIGNLATAYGIWQNGDSSSTEYTIAGGYDSGIGLNKGFLLDYDCSTGDISASDALSAPSMTLAS